MVSSEEEEEEEEEEEKGEERRSGSRARRRDASRRQPCVDFLVRYDPVDATRNGRHTPGNGWAHEARV